MTKWLGAALIFLSCGYAGYLTSFMLARRTAALRSFAEGLALLQSEIGGRQTPLLAAFRLCARQTPGEAGPFFRRLWQLLEQEPDRPAAGLLRQLLEQGDWGLAREDAAVLAALGPALGRYDSQTQVQALERQRQRLEQNLARARAEQESQGRIWRTGGLCCGAALALLIL